MKTYDITDLDHVKNLEQLLSEMQSGCFDWSDLPTFGGKEPENTEAIWSWDKTRLLIGDCIDNLEIIDR